MLQLQDPDFMPVTSEYCYAGLRYHGMGHWGCLRYIYMAYASDQGCEYVNQFYVSFGLDDPYLILIVTKCYRVL